MSDLKERIFEIIRGPQLASFATITEDGKPWVRYITARGSEDLTIRFATPKDSRKVGHIQKNPEVHLTCGVTDPKTAIASLQIEGSAEFVTDKTEREAFWHDTLKIYFTGPDDPNYGVVVVKPSRIEYNSAKDHKTEVWER
jgi:general stress protein 26